MLSFNQLFLEYGGQPPTPPGYPTQQNFQPKEPGLMDKIKSGWETFKTVAPMGALTIGSMLNIGNMMTGGNSPLLSRLGGGLSTAGMIGFLPQRFKMMNQQAHMTWQKNMVQQGYGQQPPRMQ